MRLSKIKLAGFKSFVDPTTINLPGNLVSILGPNGCGKSNTIDAVRWVMGESSAKTLRGESMTDVIFNGSSARKPVGQAMVELVFDNSDATLGGKFVNFNEVSVKRTVNRDSQSFYYLNNTRCRRKDITDLFLGTGLGPRSYSIIEQGTISKLIESKPEELRVYIEEAAGISKYKERRRETENRIRHTRENLERLEDIRTELDKQLARLQRQARTANKYKKLKQNERQVKAQLNALQWRNIDSKALEQKQSISSIETEYEKKTSELRQLELSIEQTRELHRVSNEEFNGIQGEYYRIGSQIARLEQSIEHAQQRLKQNEEDYTEAKMAYEQALQHQNVDSNKINQINIEIEKLQPQLQQYQQQTEISQQQLQDCEQQMHDWQIKWDEFNHNAQKPGQTAQVERSKINQLEQQIKRQEQKSVTLEQELEKLSIGQLETEVKQLKVQQQSIEQQITQLENTRELHRQQSSDNLEQIKQSTHKLNDAKNTFSQLNGKKASLLALQSAALGKDSHKAKKWLTEKGLSDNVRLAQLLTVEPGWESSVELLLGDFLEAICVEKEQYTLSSVELSNIQKPDFSLSLINENSTNQQVVNENLVNTRGFPFLIDLIRAEGSVKAVLTQTLSGILAVDSLKQAIDLLAELDAKTSIITRDGFYLGHNWLRFLQASDEKSGVLMREKVLKELLLEIDQTSTLIDKLQQEVDDLQQLQSKTEQLKENNQKEINQQNKQLSEAKSLLNNKQLRIEHINNRQKQINTELEENRQHILNANQEIEQATKILHTALEQIDLIAEQKQQYQQQREQLKQKLQKVKESYQQDKDHSFNLEIRVNALTSERTATEQALERVKQQLEGLKNRCSQLNDLIRTETDPIKTLENELQGFLSSKIVIDEKLSQSRNNLENLDQSIRASESQRVNLEQLLENIRNQLEQSRIHLQELKVKSQTQLDMLSDTGYELSELLMQIPENAKESDWQKELEQLLQQIKSLGSINLAAIEEFQEQQQRKEYLDEQNNDLVSALSTLEGAIAKIDKETRTRFKTTFDHINSQLKLLFPRLFGGGEAYLLLTGDDFLDTGVTIMARPPGKRNSTIHLLSGGEKAMTAVALVFAIFSLNPAPFCLLDEVDAPLDEANVGRFCNMVKEMSEQVQFVYITHNKTTMEMSDYLCGVTMKEAGVSRIVDVDIHEAVNLVES